MTRELCMPVRNEAQVSDQHVNESPEVTNARYRYPESEDRRLDHSATTRSKLNEYSGKYKS